MYRDCNHPIINFLRRLYVSNLSRHKEYIIVLLSAKFQHLSHNMRKYKGNCHCIIMLLSYRLLLYNDYMFCFPLLTQIQMYQLSRLLHDFHHRLHDHLEQNEVAPSLYAAPWFLTLFASQFPFGFVSKVFGEFLNFLQCRSGKQLL